MSGRPPTDASSLTALLTAPVGVVADAGRAAVALVGAQEAGCKSCKDFASQAEAQAYFEAHGGSPEHNVDNLDRNHNGIACEVFPYGRVGADAPTWLRAAIRRVVVPGAFAVAGWAAGRQQRRG